SLEKRARPPAPRTGIDGFVRRLVEEVESDRAPPAGAGREVMLDVRVDGVRCVLTRLPPWPSAPASARSPAWGPWLPQQDHRRRPGNQLVDGRHLPAPHLRQAECRLAGGDGRAPGRARAVEGLARAGRFRVHLLGIALTS